MKEIIVIDIGGTYMRFAFFKNGKVLNYQKKDTPKQRDKLLKELVENIKEYMNKNVKGIGISCAGPIDRGFIKDSPNLPLKNFNLKKYLQKFYRVKIEIENDGNCFALAEAKFGVKKKNFFILTLGTGVGGGIIINGDLYKGKYGAGELGHIILHNKKDIEYYFKKSKKSTTKMSDYIGQGIASLTQVFDPEVVVLGGGMRKLGRPFLNQIKQKTKTHINSLLLKAPEIRLGNLKHTELIGAGMLIK